MDVEEYRRTRYKGIDQKIINRKEYRILKEIFGAIQGNISILDVPCGYGRFSDLLLEMSSNLTSIDISFPMVVATRRYAPFTNSQHHFLVGDIKDLPLKDNSFDCVLTIRLFQHILNPSIRSQILKELHRVTKRMVIISFYRYNILHNIERWIRCRTKKIKKEIIMLPLNEFVSELNSAGFKVINLFPVMRYFHAHNIVLLQKLQA